MRDDVQYFRDLYNIERVDALKGPNAMIFGRGGSGGLLNRVSKQAVQLNVENLSDHDYYASAHSDNNISPGSPRAFTLGLNLDY